MKSSVIAEEGIRNLDRILPSRAHSICSRRKSSVSSSISRCASNISDITNISTPRSPTPFDVTEKQWFLSSAQCQMNKLKDLLPADPTYIDKKDFITYAALHWAAKDGKSELLHWLCDLGADVNIKSGYTPLHLAVMHGQALIVDILITDYDADINARDYSGRKPGHYVQSDMPTWVQRALRANQGATERPKIDALVMSTTANLAAMQGKPVARSWSSVKPENYEERPSPENISKNRTKSILRSFRKIRNKDRHTPSREHAWKAREHDLRDKLKLETRSRSVPDICLTPRSKKKLLQIEHPHFDNADIVSGKSGIDISETVKSDSERNSSDLDEVFTNDGGSQRKTTDSSPREDQNGRKDENGAVRCRESCKGGMEVKGLNSESHPRIFGNRTQVTNGVKSQPLNGELTNSEIAKKQIKTKDFKGGLTDQNSNQWKATTLV